MNRHDQKPIQKPVAGRKLASVAISGMKSPVLKIKYCTLVNPYYYPNNNPPVPRYSVTCIIEPDEHKDFIKNIQSLEKDEKINRSILLEETREDKVAQETLTTGKFLMKFQTKNKVPVILVTPGVSQTPTELEEELPYLSRVVVLFDVVRYQNKQTGEKGLSYQPKTVYFYDAEQKTVEGPWR